MIELINTYGVDQIIVLIIMLSCAIKGMLDFVEWVMKKYQNRFNIEYNKKRREEKIDNQYEICAKQHKALIERYESLDEKLDAAYGAFKLRLDGIEDKVDQLTESDMHDIKGWIVERHHLLKAQGWVDDFTMDTIEKRYSDYVAEHGNSYIKGLIDEIRALPNGTHIPK